MMSKCAVSFGLKSSQMPRCYAMSSICKRRMSKHISVTATATPVKKPHIVVALGGNAILKRGEPMTTENQKKNIKTSISSMHSLIKNNRITLVHGNGPQVGLLSLQNAEYQKRSGVQAMKLDVLDAETEGMIGYLVQQEICNQIGRDRGVISVLSQIVIDDKDLAFQNPTKFVGPVYTEEEAKKESISKTLKKDGSFWRQVVASPLPIRLIDQEMKVLRLLTESDCLVICAGGGGIPVVDNMETDSFQGVEAVIDKDRSAAMLARDLNADGLLILTDVQGVATSFATPNSKWIKSVSPEMLLKMMLEFPDGSMGPKVESVIEFVAQKGRWGMIGSLNDVEKIMSHSAGTLVTTAYGKEHLIFY